MARTVDETAQVAKRNAILDAAQRLVFTKGYEQMTVQDLLDALHISKGAFYHYFDSKTELLDALVVRIQEEIAAVLLPIVRDEHTSALEKFRLFFPVAARWKAARKDFLVEVARVAYADENALLRQKNRARALEIIAPLLTEIIRQGVAEGVVGTEYPDQIGIVVVSLALDLGDAIVSVLLSSEVDHEGIGALVSMVSAYTNAIERTLGVPEGSFPLIDPDMLNQWVADPLSASSTE